MGGMSNFRYDPDEPVIGAMYLVLLRDVLAKFNQDIQGYSGRLVSPDDYRTRMSPRAFCRALTASLNSENAGVGFYYGQRLGLLAADTVGQLIMSCSNLKDAFDILKRFHLLLSVPLKIDSEISDGYTLVTIQNFFSQKTPVYVQCFLAEALLISCIKQAGWLTGEKVTYKKIYVPYERPSHAQMYEEFFRCDIEFDARFLAVKFQSSYFELPILTANEQVKLLKANRCEKALSRRLDKCSFESKVKTILADSYPEFPTVHQLASRLNTSRSCLYRKLQSNKTSYQCLINEFKKERSIRLLKATSLTVEEVAEEMGFSDASSFRRAFKGWTGKLPSLVRA